MRTEGKSKVNDMRKIMPINIMINGIIKRGDIVPSFDFILEL